MLMFLDIVGDTLHAVGKELQIDYDAWMQMHNFGSYESVANTTVEMDTYGKLGDVFPWINPLNMAAACQLSRGGLGQFPCNGKMKLPAGFWPLQPISHYQGGVPSAAPVAEVLSAVPPLGVAFE
jgi:hypothetical protein